MKTNRIALLTLVTLAAATPTAPARVVDTAARARQFGRARERSERSAF